MIEIKDVYGYVNSSDIVNGRIVDINIDTVYVRTNIRKDEENDDLYIYDELQLTLDEWDDYKVTLALEDMNKLKEKDEMIEYLKEQNELLSGCIMELAGEVFA